MFDILKNATYNIISPRASARSRYEAFKELLKNDKQAHELLADLDQIYYQQKKVDFHFVIKRYEQLSQAVSNMVACLGRMAPGQSSNLRSYFRKIDFYCRFALSSPEIDTSPPFLLPLNATYADDSLAGGKGYNLSILQNTLKIPVPRGFIISTTAYNTFIEENDLRSRMDAILARLDIHSSESLKKSSLKLSELILKASLPTPIQKALEQGFHELQHQCGKNVAVAVRSSAVGEDSTITFAGQYLSLLDITGNNLCDAYKEVLASKFSPQALYYRITQGFHDQATPMAVLVLEMIAAKTSGVITTADSHDDTDCVLRIHSLQGRCENLVGGKRSPDTTVIKKGEKVEIISQNATKPHEPFSLPEKDARQLASWAMKIESFYKLPQEIEWCIDQEGSPIFLQTRFLRIQETKKLEKIETSSWLSLFEGGEVAANGAAAGKVFLLQDLNRLSEVPQDAILITRTTPPSLATIAHRLKAVVADEGSSADHFASVAREFNIPTIVKTRNATDIFTDNQEVTVWADQKQVFAGVIKSLVSHLSPRKEEEDSPFQKAMSIAISFISPLKLVNPADPSFVAESCRSHHDIIRFVHEKGVQSMFGLTAHKPLRKGGAKLLLSSIPVKLYLLDVGGGLNPDSKTLKALKIEDVLCSPLLALWQGLTHQGVKWQDRSHFDWEAYDDLVMAGGIVSAKSIAFASYGIISQDYLNLNMRFGYHFAILDALCSPDHGEGYITLRFAGGGGNIEGKLLRLAMISEILRRLNFTYTQKSDLLDARFVDKDNSQIYSTLDMVGRLLAATRIMDMILTDEKMAAEAVEEFMNGTYTFTKE